MSRKLKEILTAGKIGQPVAIQLSWMLRKPDDYFAEADWRIKKGGGPVLINLIHEIDLLRYFFGEVSEVSAMLSNTIRGNAVEDTGTINLRFENGALASIVISDCAPSPWHFEGGSGENPNIARTGKDGMRIFGTEGVISFPSLTQWCHAVGDGHWGTPIEATPAEDQNSMDGEVALTNQLRNFVDVINGNAEPLVDAWDGLQSVRIVEAIHQAADQRATVHMKKNRFQG